MAAAFFLAGAFLAAAFLAGAFFFAAMGMSLSGLVWYCFVLLSSRFGPGPSTHFDSCRIVSDRFSGGTERHSIGFFELLQVFLLLQMQRGGTVTSRTSARISKDGAGNTSGPLLAISANGSLWRTDVDSLANRELRLVDATSVALPVVHEEFAPEIHHDGVRLDKDSSRTLLPLGTVRRFSPHRPGTGTMRRETTPRHTRSLSD